MPEKKLGQKLASSTSTSKAKEKKKRHRTKHEVKLNRASAKSSTTKSKYFGAKKLPTTTPEPLITNEINSSRTSKSPARSVSQLTVKAACLTLTVSRTSSCPKSASTSSLSAKTNREKSRLSLKQSNHASRSLASLSHKAATTTRQSEELKGSGDAKAKKKKQNLLVAIRPSNVESERSRFMARMFDYDPRFVYLNPPADDVLERFAKPSKKLLDQVRFFFLFVSPSRHRLVRRVKLDIIK